MAKSPSMKAVGRAMSDQHKPKVKRLPSAEDMPGYPGKIAGGGQRNRQMAMRARRSIEKGSRHRAGR